MVTPVSGEADRHVALMQAASSAGEAFACTADETTPARREQGRALWIWSTIGVVAAIALYALT
jgi:hypothetical protein